MQRLRDLHLPILLLIMAFATLGILALTPKLHRPS